MFEKRKLNKFKTKIKNIDNKDFIEQLYLNSPDYIKNDKEVCEIIFNKYHLLLKVLPVDYQLDILKSGDLDMLPLVSEITQVQFLKNNFNDATITRYIDNAPDVLLEYILNNTNILNDVKFNSNAGIQLLDLMKKKDFLGTIIENDQLLNNADLVYKIIDKDKNLLARVPSEIRLNYINEHMSLIQGNFEYVSLFKYLTEQEKQETFFQVLAKKGSLIQNKEIIMMINSMNFESQMNIARRNLNCLKHCDEKVQLEMFNKDNKLLVYLSNDVKSGVIKANPCLLYETKTISRLSTLFTDSFQELNDISYSDLDINNLISSPIFSAKGSLLHVASTNGDYDMLYGINQYCESQYSFFQNMPENQITQLCMHDVNYILPLVAVNNNEQIEQVHTKIKKVFEKLYGSDMLNKYANIIDMVFDNYSLKVESKLLNLANSRETYDFQYDSNCILDLFKVIFNKEIITNNDADLIKYYVQTSLNNVSNDRAFNMLITNAYGKEAGDILTSRPNLNEHNINSLEIFSPVVLEKFGNGLVHDLISYNISNMSYFLSIIKDAERVSNLSDLYKLESNIFGANISTFQRTLNDFVNLEQLLNNIGNQEMSSSELESLYTVIINRNYGNINKKSELENYENNVKLRLLKEMKEIDDLEYVKEKICNAFFGINYKRYNDYERLQMSGQECANLYEYSNAYNSDLLSESEITMLDFLDVIIHENNKESILKIIDSLFEEQNIFGNYDFVSAMSKVKNNQEKLLNENLVNVEKLEKELEKELENDTGLVLKTFRNGVPIYILNGIEFGTLFHINGGTNNAYISSNQDNTGLERLDNLEEQYGSSTISTWYRSNNTAVGLINCETNGPRDCFIGYSKIPKGSIVGMDVPATNSNDISTDHAPKLSVSLASGGINFDRMHASNKKQEVSFYRKLRDQVQITNENHGGRFDFDYFFGDIYVEDLSKFDEIDFALQSDVAGTNIYDEAKKRNIPIILANNYAYLKGNQVVVQEQNLEKGVSK